MEKMKLTPTETIHMNFINKLIELGESKDEILFTALRGIEEKTAKSRAKKMIKKLPLKVSNPSKLIKNNE